MKKSLAKALMDAGMEHFDAGGIGGALSGVFGGQNSFQATGPQQTSQNLAPQVNTLQNQNQQVYGQQQTLAQTLLNQANGQGPNVAQNQLNQATGTNVANQAALMAGQRGSGANAGLIAREAAQQGGAQQQASAGQAATLGAQQQMSAQNAQAGLLNNIAQQSLQGQNIDQNAIASQNSSNLAAQGINANTAQANSNSASSAAGGLLSSVGSVVGLAKGGKVPMPVQHFDSGGYSMAQMPQSTILNNTAINPFAGINSPLASAPKDPMSGATNAVGDASGTAGGGLMAGGPMDALGGGSGGVPLVAMLAASHGGDIPSPHDFRTGGNVPGKAPIPGKNDPRNDIEPALLSPGEEVLPLSVTKSKDPEKAAVTFMKHLKDMKDNEKGPKGYAKVIAARKKGA